MKAVYYLPLCLLTSCEIRTNCGGSFVSNSVAESRSSGLFLAAFHPHRQNDGLLPYTTKDTIRVEQSWMERTAMVDCKTENQRFAILKGETMVLQLARPIPNEVAITLNGHHPLMMNRTLLSYDLNDSTALPQELTFQLYASPVGSYTFLFNDNRLIKTWHFTR